MKSKSSKVRKNKKVNPSAPSSLLAAFQASRANNFAQARNLKNMGPGGQQPSSSRRIGVVKRGSR